MNNAKHRYGSAGFSSTKDIARKGLLSGKGQHLGFTNERKPRQIHFSAHTSDIIFGTSGAGKQSCHIGYIGISNQRQNTVYVDMKGESAATFNMNPFVQSYLFNPYGLHSDAPWFLPTSHRFNVLDFASLKDPTFFEDMLTMAMNLINKPAGGGGTSMHFWGKAVQVATAILVDGCENNPHFSLPDFYNVAGDLQTGGGEYFDFHITRMQNSNFTAVRLTANELQAKAQMGKGEFSSITSTISNNIQCLGSTQLQMALSAPSTVSLYDFLSAEAISNLFIMIPAHLVETNAPIIRCIITALSIVQQRNPRLPLHLCLDEAGQLQGFEALPRLFSFGRGSKTKVSAYFQNPTQGIANFGKENFDTIVSNAQTKLILNCASYESAKFTVDNVLGQATYTYVPESKKVEAEHRKKAAVKKIMDGGDFVDGLLEISKHNQSLNTQDAVSRPLMTPDEVIRMDSALGIMDINNIGINPYLFKKIPAYLNPAVAHRFLPNPYHPPHDKIYLPQRFGRKKAVKIISEKVPDSISNLPQFSSGYWSYLEGFSPLKTKKFSLFKR